MATFIVLAIFCVLLLLGIPLGIAMLAACFGFLIFVSHVPLLVIPTYFVSGINSFELLAVPFFILTAEIMNEGGITRRIVGASLAMVGWLPGALAQVLIVASLIFAGISGSALADLAGLGRVGIKSMAEAGYSLKFSTSLVLASSVLGGLSQTSIVMIIYAITAGQSLGKMLLAGLLPGLLVAFCLMVFVYFSYRFKWQEFPAFKLPPLEQRIKDLVYAVPALISPLLILSGIAFGIVTPTEAGVAACIYSLLLATFVYRELTWKGVWNAINHTILSTASIMLLIGASSVLSWIITRDSVAAEAADWFAAMHYPMIFKLLIINAFLLLVGVFLEGVPALLILTPILVPAMQLMGVSPIQFGVILNFNLLLGVIHPPVGVGLFVASNMTGLRIGELARGVLPFFIPLGVALLLITYVPAISLALPTWILGQ
ncbi:MAG: TRAP transporter large permease [Janthinobacterium lividum]